MTDKCGQCQHAKIGTNKELPLNMRVCKGAPPQLLLLPGSLPGQINLTPVFPNVNINDEACGAFKHRLLTPSIPEGQVQ
jgi:hypothetical protein